MRLRFTVRGMMVAVAILAVAAAGSRRCAGLRWRAENEARSVINAGNIKGPRGRELSAYHGRLERKYRLAASRPWLPVEPDPPEPK